MSSSLSFAAHRETAGAVTTVSLAPFAVPSSSIDKKTAKDEVKGDKEETLVNYDTQKAELSKLKQTEWRDLNNPQRLSKIVNDFSIIPLDAIPLSDTQELFEAILEVVNRQPSLQSQFHAMEHFCVVEACSARGINCQEFLIKAYQPLVTGCKMKVFKLTEMLLIAQLFEKYKIAADPFEFWGTVCTFLMNYLEYESIPSSKDEDREITAIRRMGPIPLSSLVQFASVFSKITTDETCFRLILRKLQKPVENPFVPATPFNHLLLLSGSDLCSLAQVFQVRKAYAKELFAKILEQLKQDGWKKLASLTRSELNSLREAFSSGRDLSTEELSSKIRQRLFS